MKIAFIGDAHLISPNDSHKDIIERKKSTFSLGHHSFLNTLEKVEECGVEHLISLGDLVDYCSPANLDFATQLMNSYAFSWEMVMGNHDFTETEYRGDSHWLTRKSERQSHWINEWKKRGVDLTLRSKLIDRTQIILMNSYHSCTRQELSKNLRSLVSSDHHTLLVTHVPFATPNNLQYLNAIGSSRNMESYVQYDDFKIDEMDIQRVLSGHWHSSFNIKNTHHLAHGLGMSTECDYEYYNEHTRGLAQFSILDSTCPENGLSTISALEPSSSSR